MEKNLFYVCHNIYRRQARARYKVKGPSKRSSLLGSMIRPGEAILETELSRFGISTHTSYYTITCTNYHILAATREIHLKDGRKIRFFYFSSRLQICLQS